MPRHRLHEEAAEFTRHPDPEATLRVRIGDDRGKVENMPTRPFEHCAPLLQRVVNVNRP